MSLGLKVKLLVHLGVRQKQQLTITTHKEGNHHMTATVMKKQNLLTMTDTLRAYLGLGENYSVSQMPEKFASVISMNGKQMFLNMIKNGASGSFVIPVGVTTIRDYAFYDSSLTITELPDGITEIHSFAFESCPNLSITKLPDSLVYLYNGAFVNSPNVAITRIPANVKTIGASVFGNGMSPNTTLTSITFEGTPTKIDGLAFNRCNNLTTINVPWSEGEVAGAPWGATKATINYNYTGE
jgi:hypothetical protein